MHACLGDYPGAPLGCFWSEYIDHPLAELAEGREDLILTFDVSPVFHC